MDGMDMGMTPRQARALVRWQTDQIVQAQARQLEAGQQASGSPAAAMPRINLADGGLLFVDA